MEIPVLKESGVVFKEDSHQYFLGDKELLGITSTLVHRAFPHDYDGVTEEKLAERAEYGRKVHEMLEFCITNGLTSEMPEWGMFEQMVNDNGLTVIRCEYIVTDYERYASPIDLVMMDKDGGIWLVDLKTNWKAPVEKATCQLSWYKRRFEEMNPELHVVGCAIAWVRNEDKRGQLSKWIPIVPWADELLDALIQCDLEDKDFAPIVQSYGDFPAKFAEVEDEIARIEIAVKVAKERQDELRKGLYDLMTKYDKKSFTGSRIKLTRVLPSTSEKFDVKAFKAENPDMFKKYCKKSETAGSLRVTLVEK